MVEDIPSLEGVCCETSSEKHEIGLSRTAWYDLNIQMFEYLLY